MRRKSHAPCERGEKLEITSKVYLSVSPLIHPTEDRTLTVAEAKALQGLPGSFRICGTLSQMQQQVGNSVPVAIGRYIKNALLKMLDAAAKPRLQTAAVMA